MTQTILICEHLNLCVWEGLQSMRVCVCVHAEGIEQYVSWWQGVGVLNSISESSETDMHCIYIKKVAD